MSLQVKGKYQSVSSSERKISKSSLSQSKKRKKRRHRYWTLKMHVA